MTNEIFKALRDHRDRKPDHVALQILGEEGIETFTLARIWEEISRVSRFLADRVAPGETVGILMENHPRWGIAFLAAQSAGVRIVPFDILHSAETLAGLIQHSRCSYLISSAACLLQLQEIQSLLPSPLPGLISGTGTEPYDEWDAVLAHNPESESLPLVERDIDETFLVVYTSGTTGNPKGVMLTPRSIYTTVKAVLERVDATEKDHILSVLPLYHMLALMANFLMPLYLGARVTYLDALDPNQILRCFREQGITIFVCVPQFFYVVHRKIFHEVEKRRFLQRFLFHRLLKVSDLVSGLLGSRPGKIFFKSIHRNFGQLRFFAVGGARCDPEILRSFRNLGFPFVQAFGMTETSAVTTIAYGGGLGSVGRPLPHAEIRIGDPDSSGIGEILIKGPHVMQGYWKNEEATAEVLSQGWLHSGDLGYIDAEGYLFITGRKKDVIVLSSGKNIFPEEVEQAYETKCPFIREMCVIGVQEERGQESLHALIVPDFEYMKKQQIVNVSDMIRYQLENLSQQVPPHKRIRSFDISRVPLPRTPTRKIKRFEVEKDFERLKNAQPTGEVHQDEEPPTDSVEEKLFALLRETGKVSSVRSQMNLEFDCGFDSLGRVEFISNVQEAFGINIPDDTAMQLFTVDDVARCVRASLERGGEAAQGGERLSWGEILSTPLTSEEESEIHRLLRRRPFVEAFYFFLSRCIWVIGKLFLRLRFEGQDNLRLAGPHLICPNHLSYIDAFVLSSGLPLSTIRRMFYVGYSNYFRPGTLTGFLGSLIKVVPVDPDRNLRQALRLGAYGLNEQLVLGIFPEGERSIDGELKAFRRGPAILALEMGVPAVPVAILGTFQVWSRASSKVRLHPVTIRFGTPLHPGANETYEEFNQRLRDSVEQLLEMSSG